MPLSVNCKYIYSFVPNTPHTVAKFCEGMSHLPNLHRRQTVGTNIGQNFNSFLVIMCNYKEIVSIVTASANINEDNRDDLSR